MRTPTCFPARQPPTTQGRAPCMCAHDPKHHDAPRHSSAHLDTSSCTPTCVLMTPTHHDAPQHPMCTLTHQHAPDTPAQAHYTNMCTHPPGAHTHTSTPQLSPHHTNMHTHAPDTPTLTPPHRHAHESAPQHAKALHNTPMSTPSHQRAPQHSEWGAPCRLPVHLSFPEGNRS
jgi:hypothetical protein